MTLLIITVVFAVYVIFSGVIFGKAFAEDSIRPVIVMMIIILPVILIFAKVHVDLLKLPVQVFVSVVGLYLLNCFSLLISRNYYMKKVK